MFLFDLDGPIVDVSEKYYRIYSDLVQELHGIPLSKSDYWSRKRNRIPERQTLVASNVSADAFTSYRDLRKARIETPAYWKWDRVWPELANVMTDSPLKGHVVLVTLRNSKEALLEELQWMGILDWFNAILCTSGDAAESGRHSCKIRLVNEKFGNISRGWFVGDTETDLRAGKALGLQRVAVSFGIRSIELIAKEEPEKIFHCPGELGAWIESCEFD